MDIKELFENQFQEVNIEGISFKIKKKIEHGKMMKYINETMDTSGKEVKIREGAIDKNILYFVADWDITENGKKLAINLENINKLPYNITQKLIEKINEIVFVSEVETKN